MNPLLLFSVTCAILALAAILMMGRLVAGPTSADRLLAFDSMNTLVIAIMILLSAVYDSVVMVDISIVYAALAFVGTLFIARYIEGEI